MDAQTVPLLVDTNEYILAQILATSNMKLDWIVKVSSMIGSGGGICMWPVSTIGSLIVPFILPGLFLVQLGFVYICSVMFLHCYYPKREWRARRMQNNHKYICTLWNLGFIVYLGVTIACFNLFLGLRINGEIVVAAAPAYRYFEYPHNLLFVFGCLVMFLFCIPFPIASVRQSHKLFVTGGSYLANIKLQVKLAHHEENEDSDNRYSQPNWMRNSDDMHQALKEEYTEFLYNTHSSAYQRYGVLFFPFKPEFHWWKVVILATRAALAMVYVGMKFYPAW